MNKAESNIRVRSSGSFELPMHLDQAFGLFTAEGERGWVPGWSPVILGELPQHPGMVFVTGPAEQPTIWTVLESDAGKLAHRYSRVTPGQTAGIVEVELCSTATGCRVGVSYDLTALSPDGEVALAGYRGDAFAAMLDKWRHLITTAPHTRELVTAD